MEVGEGGLKLALKFACGRAGAVAGTHGAAGGGRCAELAACGERGSPGRAGPAARPPLACSSAGGGGGAREGAVLPLSAGSHQ